MFRPALLSILFCSTLTLAQVPATQPSVETKELAPAKPAAANGDTLFVIYTGKLQNGTVFDSNVNGRLFRFTLGSGEVIKGWDLGMLGMQVGEKRELIVPPELGYGKGSHDRIPADSTLDFTVELVGLVRVPK
jgi:FK506-binding nuclear protein